MIRYYFDNTILITLKHFILPNIEYFRTGVKVPNIEYFMCFFGVSVLFMLVTSTGNP